MDSWDQFSPRKIAVRSAGPSATSRLPPLHDLVGMPAAVSGVIGPRGHGGTAVPTPGHEELESPELAFGKNVTDKLTGTRILDTQATGTASFDHVGRKNGVSGRELAADIAIVAWRTRKYEVRLGALPGEPKNWFTLADVVVATITGPTAVNP